MNMNDKLISVYIVSCERNGPLRRAIDSVLSQTHQNYEIIVVDDCSESFSLDEFAKNYPQENISFYRLGKRSGANVARNIALNKAKGKYITGLDDDDFFHPQRLSFLLEAYCQKSVSFVSSRYHYYEKENQDNYIKKIKKQFFQLSIFNLIISKENMLSNNCAGNHVLTETSKLKAINGFDESLPAFQDYDTWIRLIKKFGNGLKIAKALYYKENLPNSITEFNKKKLQGLDKVIENNHDFFQGYEHCIELHKQMYKFGKIPFSEALRLFKKNNRFYLFKLFIRKKILFFNKVKESHKL